MQSKSLLIAIAAFAVTATGAQAYVGAKYFGEAGLSVAQVQAFNQAREFRRQGDLDKARDVLLSAGVAEETVISLRRAASVAQGALHQAVEANDFTAFREVVAGTLLSELITTEADFALFKQAHDLKIAGKFTEALAILEGLDIEAPMMGHYGLGRNQQHFLALSGEQRDALRAARQANDQETVIAILKEAGIDEGVLNERHEKRHMRHEQQW